MTLIDGETPNELDELETIGEILGFVDKRDGREVFKATLDEVVRRGETRESMQMAACELKAAGKNQTAELAKAAAARCPSMTDLRFCPYMEPPYVNNPSDNEANIKMWLWSEKRRAERKRQKCRELLSKKGIDPDWIESGKETDAAGA
jgi:hypothetical protein